MSACIMYLCGGILNRVRYSIRSVFKASFDRFKRSANQNWSLLFLFLNVCLVTNIQIQMEFVLFSQTTRSRTSTRNAPNVQKFTRISNYMEPSFQASREVKMIEKEEEKNQNRGSVVIFIAKVLMSYLSRKYITCI